MLNNTTVNMVVGIVANDDLVCICVSSAISQSKLTIAELGQPLFSKHNTLTNMNNIVIIIGGCVHHLAHCAKVIEC